MNNQSRIRAQLYSSLCNLGQKSKLKFNIDGWKVIEQLKQFEICLKEIK